MKQSDISSSSTTSSKQCGCSPSSTPVVGSFQFANISSFGMGTGCPSFAELNTLQQQLIDMQNAHESGQVQGFNADYAQRIGGYPKTALVSDPNDPTRLFISKADDNTADPTKDTTGAWFPLTDTLTATRDAIAKEEQRARSAEAALQPKGDYATNESLNAEIERAKTAEATYLPLTGGTLEGDVTIKRTHHWNNNRGGGQTTLAMDDGPEKFYQQLYRNNGEMTQGILGITDETGDHHWKLQTDGTIITPSGNSIPEVVGSQGRTVIQAWKTKCKNHDWISFPQEFLGKPISLQLTAEHTPNSAPSICVGYYEATQTAQGFEVDLRWLDDNSSGSQTDPITINILAIGPM